jgi:bifunctional DNA-binding transcriptional regulator/antitoxin component of YhaV-PrlF toxin-antitoxin module
MKEEFETPLLFSTIRQKVKDKEYVNTQYKVNLPKKAIEKLGLKRGDRVHITIEKSDGN